MHTLKMSANKRDKLGIVHFGNDIYGYTQFSGTTRHMILRSPFWIWKFWDMSIASYLCSEVWKGRIYSLM